MPILQTDAQNMFVAQLLVHITTQLNPKQIVILQNTNVSIFAYLYVHIPCCWSHVPWLQLELKRFIKVSIQAI